jgi:septum site-determining protein MinC
MRKAHRGKTWTGVVSYPLRGPPHATLAPLPSLHCPPGFSMTQPLSAPDVPPAIVDFDDSVPVIRLPAHLPFEEARDWLRSRLPEHLDRVAGRASRLDIGSREIRLFDLRRILSFLREQFEVEITGLYAEQRHILKYAERELKLKLFPTTPEESPESSPADVAAAHAEGVDEDEELVPQSDGQTPDTAEVELREVSEAETAEEVEALPETAVPQVEADPVAQVPPALLNTGPATHGERTLTLHRTLRSGAVVRFDGDVLLFGDVNPGAQVLAAGNIVVLGTVKGMAHAGAAGDETAFIFAFDLRPTQLRIGRKIAIVPGAKPGPSGMTPDIARIEDGKIVIEPYKSGSSR